MKNKEISYEDIKKVATKNLNTNRNFKKWGLDK